MSINFYWTVNINYSLVTVHIMLNHYPRTIWQCTPTLLFSLPSTFLISSGTSFSQSPFISTNKHCRHFVLHVSGPTISTTLDKDHKSKRLGEQMRQSEKWRRVRNKRFKKARLRLMPVNMLIFQLINIFMLNLSCNLNYTPGKFGDLI